MFLTDGQNVTLHAPFPSPPGSPLVCALRGTQHELRVKVHGCRRLAPIPHSDSAVLADLFEITGRWVNLSREARLILLGQTEPV